MIADMSHPNVFESPHEYDAEDPPGFRCGALHLSKATGATELAVKSFELPPGETLCPYHYEYVEEWLVVLEGELRVRTPTGVEQLTTGDVMAFPIGPDGAHRVSNPSTAPARALMFSSGREPSVSVYPDSDKIGVWAGTEADQFILHRTDGHVPYYDGEAPTE
jgi:uncharacterized cupin superfamily protein